MKPPRILCACSWRGECQKALSNCQKFQDRHFNKRRTSNSLISFGQTPDSNAYLSWSSPPFLIVDGKSLLKASFIEEHVRRNLVVHRFNSSQSLILQSPISLVCPSCRRCQVQEESGLWTCWVCPLVRQEISTPLEAVWRPLLSNQRSKGILNVA